ncbi:MAG: hypothetical protein ACJAUV_000028 [Flavobacteriales bacterium]|jgi:hypothetical protein
MRFLCLFLLLPFLSYGQWPSNFNYGNESKSYAKLIEAYEALDKKYTSAILIEIGKTDIGKPLHAFIIDGSNNFDAVPVATRKKPVLFINNGIHPGEPCGIDASLLLAQQMLSSNIPIPNAQVIIIPAFNVGGMLNRSCCSRANQNGPEMYGFRGNAQNLDLNRDFVKNDALNTQSLMRFLAQRDPDVFIDTHTSNGADYQYTMTLIQSQPNKMEAGVAALQNDVLTPFLYKRMANLDYPMVPYVYSVKQTPDDGIKDYLDTPRYSTGYTAFRNTLSFVSETHMWKPFEERVKSTYLLLYTAASWMETNALQLIQARRQAHQKVSEIKTVGIQWALDTTIVDSISFLGYEASYIPSEISQSDRLFYDRTKPFTKNIAYYHTYKTSLTTTLPKYYIIPQAWVKIVDKLKIAGVKVHQLKKEGTLLVNQSYVKSFKTTDKPYEGHYLHYDTQTEKVQDYLPFYTNDFVVETNQLTNLFIGNVLTPEGVDSYFNWGFFDAIVQQKEWFSDYVFEEKALEILNNDTDLQAKLDKAKQLDKDLAKSHWKQLLFIYQASEYYEKSVNRYPVYEFNGKLGNWID